MKAKLIKIHDQFYLYNREDDFIASTENNPYQRLSMKNCQAIERGYDLDELFNDVDKSIDYHEFDFTSFRLGVESILKLMGDKKFSEEDVIKIAEYIRVASQSTPNVRTKELFDEYQSLQQTEWDVEIEMVPALSNNGNVYYGDIPKLDADGCLILKRI